MLFNVRQNNKERVELKIKSKRHSLFYLIVFYSVAVLATASTDGKEAAEKK